MFINCWSVTASTAFGIGDLIVCCNHFQNFFVFVFNPFLPAFSSQHV